MCKYKNAMDINDAMNMCLDGGFAHCLLKDANETEITMEGNRPGWFSTTIFEVRGPWYGYSSVDKLIENFPQARNVLWHKGKSPRFIEEFGAG